MYWRDNNRGDPTLEATPLSRKRNRHNNNIGYMSEKLKKKWAAPKGRATHFSGNDNTYESHNYYIGMVYGNFKKKGGLYGRPFLKFSAIIPIINV